MCVCVCVCACACACACACVCACVTHLLLQLCLQGFHRFQKLAVSYLQFMALGGFLCFDFPLQLTNLHTQEGTVKCSLRSLPSSVHPPLSPSSVSSSLPPHLPPYLTPVVFFKSSQRTRDVSHTLTSFSSSNILDLSLCCSSAAAARLPPEEAVVVPVLTGCWVMCAPSLMVFCAERSFPCKILFSLSALGEQMCS